MIFDGSSSCRTDRYNWTICELTPNGSESNCKSQNFYLNSGSFNAKDFYTFEAGKRYRVKLNVSNDCGDGIPASKDISIELASNKIAYKNLLICSGAPAEIKIQGTNNCLGCQFTWAPFYRVLNSQEPFPTLRTPMPLCHTYLTVTARDEDNCEFKQENIDVFNIGNIQLNIASIDMDNRTNTGSYCYYKVVGEVQFECAIPQDKFSLILSRNGRNEFLQDEIIASADNKTYQYVFYVPTNQGHSNMILKIDFNDPSYQLIGDCQVTKSFNLPIRDIYWQPLLTVNGPLAGSSMLIPNVFSPNGDGINDDFRAFSIAGQGYRAFWYKTEIFNRWGGKVFEKEEYAPVPTLNSISLFGDDQWIHWDGKFQGQVVPNEVHVWYINMANCSNPQQYYIPQYYPTAWKGSVIPAR